MGLYALCYLCLEHVSLKLLYCALQCSLDGEVAAGAGLSPRLSLQG